jgi:phosphoglycerate dehydrogenase-like enzyme
MGRRDRLAAIVDLLPGTLDKASFAERLPELSEVEVIFSTWGMPAPTPQQLEAMPKLKAVFYAAGTVQQFARPLLQRGITVVSAWRANAVPVAEFALAQILLSTKSYFANCDAYRTPKSFDQAPRGDGNFGQTVALLGVGAIGRRVIELLKPFHLDVVVFDPYLSDEDAQAMGVRKVSLDAAFSEAIVVSNHLANLPATIGMLRGSHFALLRKNATFINTGRGAQVNEPEMIAALRSRPDVYALLDVTSPEPPVASSPLWSMPNVRLSSHIAGSLGNEVVRMADLVIEEFHRWDAGQPLQHQVTMEMLDRMA